MACLGSWCRVETQLGAFGQGSTFPFALLGLSGSFDEQPTIITKMASKLENPLPIVLFHLCFSRKLVHFVIDLFSFLVLIQVEDGEAQLYISLEMRRRRFQRPRAHRE